MLKIRVPNSVASARLATCKACPFYNDGWCGTPVVGRKLTKKEKKEHGIPEDQKVKLCGCKLSAKVHFHLASCPAGKWGRVALTDREIAQLRTLVDKVREAGRADGMEVNELFRMKSRLLGVNVPASYCGPCVKTLIEELDHALQGA